MTYTFHFILRHPLWDSERVHSPSSIELIFFPLWKNHVSQGLLFLWYSHIILHGLSLVWYLPILLIKSMWAFIVSVIYFYSERPPLRSILFYVWSISIAKDRCYSKYFILCVVYFYSERPAPSKLFYSMCGLFLQRKTATIKIISFYVWSISIAKDRHYQKYFILCVVYFYSERPPLCRGV